MKKNKILIPISVIAGLSAIAPVVALTSCNKPKSDDSHIVDPTQEEKTAILEAGKTKGTYEITLKEDAASEHMIVEPLSLTNNEEVEISNVKVENKKLTFDVNFKSDLHDTGTATATFSIKVTNSKTSWEKTITGYTMTFTSKPIESVVLLDSALQLEWLTENAGHIAFSSHSPITAKVDHYEYTSDNPTKVSVTNNGDVTVKELFTGTIDINCVAVDSFGNKSQAAKCAISAKNTVNGITISGQHNLDYSNTSGFQFTAKDTTTGQRDQTSNVTWKVVEGKGDNLVEFDTNTKGLLKIKQSAKTAGIGGSATISANITGLAQPVEFEVEIATFDKLKTDDGTYSLQKGIAAKKDENVTGLVVIPSRYYVNDTIKWKPTIEIPSSGLNAIGITNIYISKSISYIGAQCFGIGLAGLVVDSANAKFKSPENSNCIIETDAKKLVKGCKNTLIPEDATVVTKIANIAFYNQQFSNDLTIPANITFIEKGAFENATFASNTGVVLEDSYWDFKVKDAEGEDVPYVWRPSLLSSSNNISFLKDSTYMLCNLTKSANPEYSFSDISGGSAISKSSSFVVPDDWEAVIPAAVVDGNTTKNIVAVADDGFKQCDKLIGVDMMYTLGNFTIGNSAFYGCTALVNAFLPCATDSQLTISQYAFYGCTGLESITAVETIVDIESNAFQGCDNLDEVLVDSTYVQNSSTSCGSLLEYATYVYVLDDLGDPVTTSYIYQNFNKGIQSESYFVWTRK